MAGFGESPFGVAPFGVESFGPRDLRVTVGRLRLGSLTGQARTCTLSAQVRVL